MTLDEQIIQIDELIEMLKKDFEYHLETDQLLSAAAAQGRIDDLYGLKNLLKQRRIEQIAKEALDDTIDAYKPELREDDETI